MRSFSLELSDEIADRLADIAYRNHISRDEAVLRAFDLLAIMDEAKQVDRRNCVGIIRLNGDQQWEVVGRISLGA